MLIKNPGVTKNFWCFFLQPASLTPFVFLRISFAVFSLCLCYSIYPYMNDLYGNEGYMQWVISDHIFKKEFMPNIHNLYNWFNHFSTFSDIEVIKISFGVYILCLVCIGLGFFSNVFAAIGWFIHLIFLNTGNIYGYGVETFIHILLFYFIFMPVDAKFSLKAMLLKKKFRSEKTKRHHQVMARIFIRLLQIHLCLIYFNAGLAKTFGTHWWNGEGAWRSLTQFQYNTFNLTWLYKFPLLLKIAGWSVMALETLYGAFIWWQPTRKLFLYGIICIHLCIGIFMGLYFFAAIMIIINIAAFAFDLEDHTTKCSKLSLATNPTNAVNFSS